MAASAPTRLGPYEIVSRLGKGGMGEVWRARDPRLNREVAIKVSAQQFTDRFEREAHAIAALNHSNICTLFDVGPNYLVMELIEGPTLAERIAQGPVPLEEALGIARQIADALEAAHEKGIVHRDLKPANIKIRPDGSVKVLDFGLAKSATEPEVTNDSPTMLSVSGMILGTAGYMSPEQARGQNVDKRSDIWAFGVVLYEMLTAQRLFDGGTISDSLAAILTKEPDLTLVPQKTRRLLAACLEKDPRKRLRDIGDWTRLLEAQVGQTVPSVQRAKGLPYKVAAAVLAVLLAGLALVHFREKPAVAPLVNSTLLPPDGTDYNFTGGAGLPALSPDGTRIVFGARPKDGKTQLYVRRLDSPGAQPLPGTEGALFPFWSPESRWVAFSQGNKVKKIDIQGGPPVTVTELAGQGQIRGGSWNPAGVILLGSFDGASILRVAAAGGTVTPATPVEGTTIPVYPWFLPDGRHFLYTSRQTGDIPVRVGSLDEPGKPGKVVAQAQSDVVYTQGHLLYLRENTLMAQPFDPSRLETTGEAVPLAEGVPTFLTPSRPAAFTVSAAGMLAYQSGGATYQNRLVWKDREGKTLGPLGGESGVVTVNPTLSPDGKRLAVSLSDNNLNQNGSLWIYDTARGIPTRFTFGSTRNTNPVWSPDGNTLYFSSTRTGNGRDLYRKASNGSGAEELLFSDSNDKLATSVSPDGQWLLYYTAAGGKTGADIWVLPLTPGRSGGKPEPRVFLQTPFNEDRGQFSPDGRWVAYVSNESGRDEVYAVPFPGPGGKRQISSGGGSVPKWRGDGKELFYVTSAGQMMAAEVTEGNGTLEVGRVQQLFEVFNLGDYYAASADGQKFAVEERSDGGTAARPLTLVQNWTAGLRK